MANAEEEEDVEEPLDCGICFLPLDVPPTFMILRSWAPDLLALPRHARGGGGDVPRLQRQGRRLGSRRSLDRDVWPAYYEPHDHSGALHGPCRCPGDARGFVGSTAALLCHFVSTHDWPVHTGVTSEDSLGSPFIN
ncbi:uncharacterized protein [Aegilops tauschii subsp. strangulata]|uniref:uncharacterized protein n=1 Tax=Aegilops tauschii subsp. strangulata TaxID=200361 RepID=UPI001ABD3646|nr:uncharacterized protein LOC120970266 [Aegilops tauschii subsp. strangulata]